MGGGGDESAKNVPSFRPSWIMTVHILKPFVRFALSGKAKENVRVKGQTKMIRSGHQVCLRSFSTTQLKSCLVSDS